MASWEQERLLIANALEGDPNLKRANGRTALHTAIKWDCAKEAKTLIEKGAKVNTIDHHGWTPLMEAAFNGRVHLITFLVEHGADLDATHPAHGTALELAEHFGNQWEAEEEDKKKRLECAAVLRDLIAKRDKESEEKIAAALQQAAADKPSLFGRFFSRFAKPDR